MCRCQYLTSVSVVSIFVGIFISWFGIQYRYFKISRYQYQYSVFCYCQGKKCYWFSPNLAADHIRCNLRLPTFLFDLVYFLLFYSSLEQLQIKLTTVY